MTKDKVFSCIGATNHTDKNREKYDFYSTPKIATEELLKVVKFDGNILECACGTGAISKVLNQKLISKSKFTIIIDGQTIYSEGVGILIANFSRIQFDIPITHDNKPRDGKLDIIILKGSTAFDLIPAFIAGIRDRAGEYPDRSEALEIHSAESVEVHADPPLEVQYDGEPVKLTTPFKVRVLKRAVRFYISEEGYDLFA